MSDTTAIQFGYDCQPSADRPISRRWLCSALVVGLASGIAPMALTYPAQHSDTSLLPTALPQTQHTSYVSLRGGRPGELELRDWEAFRARFIRHDGRVVDTFNHGISHTESQGLGMLFSVSYDDRVTFDLIYNWTLANLRRPSDSLFCWRYDPNAACPVSDFNNATDGDIYIAAALARAASRWNVPEYQQAAIAMAADIAGLLIMEVGGRLVLLPGAFGFVQADYVRVNASYYIFPLIEELRTIHPLLIWDRLMADGRAMLSEATFGEWNLPPDWLRVSQTDGALSVDGVEPSRFSFDAIRVPLFIAWSGNTGLSLAAFRSFWGKRPNAAPAWVDLQTGDVAHYALSGGGLAIARLIGCGGERPAQATIPRIGASDEYYSGALILLSRIALRESSTVGS